jgi:hypothetical protein
MSYATDTLTTTDVLRKAAHEIAQPGGWWHPVHAPGGRGCASNWIRRAAGGVGGLMTGPDRALSLDAHYALADVLGVRGLVGIFDWNDRPETTLEDAVALLRQTAETVQASCEPTTIPVVTS